MKITSSAIFAALAFSVIPAVHAGDVVTLTWKRSASDADSTKTAAIELGVGESIKALWGGTLENEGVKQIYGSGGVRLSVTKEGETYTAPLIIHSVFSNTGVSSQPFQLAGPAVIRMVPYDSSTGTSTATFEVTRVGIASPPAEVPQEAGSNFDVILEQSSDLVNWTPANPGTYSGTETKRFFRTRIVKKP